MITSRPSASSPTPLTTAVVAAIASPVSSSESVTVIVKTPAEA
jgi:hypothetical protein